jgi:thymidylate kinase
MHASSVRVVSFSGIDGAGKSAHIDALCCDLKNSGFRYSVLTFWDDVVAFGRLREHMSLKAFKGDDGIGTPEKPIIRRDKNVSAWYLTALRIVLYTFDALRLRTIVARKMRSGEDFIIFDRYIYDEFANLPLERASIRLYVRLLQQFIPKPDIAFLVDADPTAAVLRKPEYPVKFVRRNRESYLTLSRLIGPLTIIPALSLEEAIALMKRIISEKLTSAETPQYGSRPQLDVFTQVAKPSNR